MFFNTKKSAKKILMPTNDFVFMENMYFYCAFLMEKL